jgi:hypothetical protein
MKQLIGLARLGALTALSVALYGAHQQTEANHNRSVKKTDRRAEPKRELVLLGLDGTVIAREVNLAPHGT